MKTGTPHKLETVIRDLRDDRRGATLPIVAVFMMVGIGISALAIDAGYLYSLKSKIQATADAAALAAARELPEVDAAGAAAATLASANMPAGDHGAVLAGEDVTTGNWDAETRVFSPGSSPIDTVRVIIQRSEANGNAVGLFFARALGFDEVDLTTSAIAAKIPPDVCYTNGMVAGNRVEASSNEQVLDSFCVYGRNGVKVGSTNTFADGTMVGMLDLDALEAGADNTGLDDALVEMDLTPSKAADVTSLIAGLPADLPDYITQTEFVSDLPDPPVAGTAYIVDQGVDIGSSTVLSDVVIVSTGKITVGSNSSLANVILAAGDNVEIASNTAIGDSDYCTGSGDGSVQILAANHVKVGSNTSFSGAQLIAGLDADLGSHEISATALAVQVGNDIKLGSNLELGVCDDGPSEHTRFSESENGTSLVM